jgi:epoxide hydrolase
VLLPLGLPRPGGLVSGHGPGESKPGTLAGPKLTLPVAVIVFPEGIPRLIHYGEPDRGGHFAALEQPGILVSEIAPACAPLRS